MSALDSTDSPAARVAIAELHSFSQLRADGGHGVRNRVAAIRRRLEDLAIALAADAATNDAPMAQEEVR